jgi:hypothetical protein
MRSSTAEAALRRTRSAWPGLFVLLFFAGNLELTRGPYVQSITATSAIIVWRTDQPGSSRVDYGVGSYTHSIDLPDLTVEHVITLTNLITDTEVLIASRPAASILASGSFRAPPISIGHSLRRDR